MICDLMIVLFPTRRSTDLGMSDLRQRVVFREQRDRGAGRTDARAERRLHATELLFHFVTVFLEQCGDVLHRGPLLIRELGRAVDRARKRDEFGTQCVGGHAVTLAPFWIDRRREASEARRRVAAASASTTSRALRCARSVTQASRIASEWPAIGAGVTGKRTQSVG